MKLYIVVVAFATLAVALASKYTRCDEEEDCEDDECCIVQGYIPFRKGKCTKLSKEGKYCKTEDDKVEFFGGKYYFHCPCEEGLECVPEQGRSHNRNHKCRKPSTTEAPSTTTAVSEEPSTAAPEESSTVAPEEPSTAAPEESSTAAPQEPTTEGGGSSITAESVESTAESEDGDGAGDITEDGDSGEGGEGTEVTSQA